MTVSHDTATLMVGQLRVPVPVSGHGVARLASRRSAQVEKGVV